MVLTEEERYNACYPYSISRNESYFINYAFKVNVSLGLFIIGLLYVVISTARFIYYRRYFIRLKKRSLVLVLFTVLGVVMQLTGGVLDIAVLLPCYIAKFLLSMIIPVISLPVPVKLLDYYYKYIFAQALLDTINNDPSFLSTRVSDSGDSSSNSNSENRGEQNRRQALALAWKLLRKGNINDVGYKDIDNENKYDGRVANSVDANATTTAAVTAISRGHSSTSKIIITEGTIYLMKFLTSTAMQAIIFLAMLLPFVIVIAVDYSTVSYLFISSDCYNCSLTPLQRYMILVGGLGIVILGVLFALLVRKYPDPFGVVQECRLFAQYGGIIALIGFLCDVFIPQYEYFSFGWIIYFSTIIIQFITTDLQIIQAKKQAAERNNLKNRNRTRNGSTILMSMKDTEFASGTTLQMILDDPVERGYFERHLVGEFAVEIITMYNDCHDFQKSFYDMSEATRRARAKRIVEKHVSDKAVMQVNLPGEMRSKLIKMVNDQNTPINVDIFARAEKELFAMLYGSFQRYIHSNLYKQTHPTS